MPPPLADSRRSASQAVLAKPIAGPPNHQEVQVRGANQLGQAGAAPVYLPQNQPAQMKPGSRPATSAPPAAPPVYRPVPTASQQKAVSLATSARSGAPPVYRPSAATPQLKPTAAPPVYRPVTTASQQKAASLATPSPPGIPTAGRMPTTVPPVYQPQSGPKAAQGKVAAPHQIASPISVRTAVQARIAVTGSPASANKAARPSTIQPMPRGTGIGAVVSVAAWATGWGALISIVPLAVGIAADYYMMPGNAMTLAAVGSPVNLDRITATVYGVGQPTGLAAGDTPPPTDSLEPQYVINLVSGADGHRARLRLTRNASSGTNRCEYLTTGVYPTTRYYNQSDHERFGGGISNYLDTRIGTGKPRCYFVMHDDIAQMNKRAEEEHAHDYILAYELTLGRIQGILESVSRREFGPYSTPVEARQAVDNAITGAIPSQYAGLALNMPAWKAKFEQLCAKSKRRDTSNWHSWGLELEPDSYAPTWSRKDPNAVYLRYTVGQAQVGVHSSSSVIEN